MDDEEIAREIENVAKEIDFAVLKVKIHEDNHSKLTIVSHEGVSYGLALSNRGFLVEKQSNPERANLEGRYFETIYSFLDTASPNYRKSFAQNLTDKLNELPQS